MAYMLYKKTRTASGNKYKLVDYVSLLGYVNGYIPRLLRKQLVNNPKKHESPLAWHIDVLKALHKEDEDHANTTLVIDLKEKQKETNLSLYELLNVWGYSENSWSPMMLHVVPLFMDADPKTLDPDIRNEFEREDSQIGDPAYTFLYANGGIQDGELAFDWKPPGPNNAPVLWHHALQHFLRGVKCKTPEVWEKL